MLDALRQYVSRYVSLTDEEFAEIAGMLEIRSFDRREILLQVGEKEAYLNFIVKGLVRKYFLKGGTEVITHIAKEGEMVSSSASLLSGSPSEFIVETLEPSTLLSISRVHLEKLYQYSPRFERLGRLVITHLFLQYEEWEQGCMRMDMRERFVHFVERNPDLLQRVPQKFLASYLNMKPETFSRLKHLLRKKAAPVKRNK